MRNLLQQHQRRHQLQDNLLVIINAITYIQSSQQSIESSHRRHANTYNEANVSETVASEDTSQLFVPHNNGGYDGASHGP